MGYFPVFCLTPGFIPITLSAMMSLKDQLLLIAQTYAEAVGTRGRDGLPSLAGISTRVFGDGKTFGRIAAGGDLTTGSFERAMRWFSENWPAGTEWPEAVKRPGAPTVLPSSESPEAA